LIIFKPGTTGSDCGERRVDEKGEKEQRPITGGKSKEESIHSLPFFVGR